MRAPQIVSLVAFGVVLATIAFATLSPVSLRPQTGHVHSERVLAYLALGATLSFAFPKRWPWLLLGVVVIAFGLEWLQTLIPTRDGRLPDALEKAAGGAAGVSFGLLAATAEEACRPGAPLDDRTG